MIVLTDDEGRENEGELVLAAQFVSPEAVTFMLTRARGYMCLSLTDAACERLSLPPQSPVNTSVRSTPFTVSIDGHPRPARVAERTPWGGYTLVDDGVPAFPIGG